MQGHSFEMTLLPFSYWAMMDFNPNMKSRRDAFVNQSGAKSFKTNFLSSPSRIFQNFLTCRIRPHNYECDL